MVNLKKEKNSDIVLLAVNTDKKNEYGRIILNDEDKVKKIVEFKDATTDQKNISLCNSGIMLLKSEVLKKLITKSNLFLLLVFQDVVLPWWKK